MEILEDNSKFYPPVSPLSELHWKHVINLSPFVPEILPFQCRLPLPDHCRSFDKKVETYHQISLLFFRLKFLQNKSDCHNSPVCDSKQKNLIETINIHELHVFQFRQIRLF